MPKALRKNDETLNPRSRHQGGVFCHSQYFTTKASVRVRVNGGGRVTDDFPNQNAYTVTDPQPPCSRRQGSAMVNSNVTSTKTSVRLRLEVGLGLPIALRKKAYAATNPNLRSHRQGGVTVIFQQYTTKALIRVRVRVRVTDDSPNQNSYTATNPQPTFSHRPRGDIYQRRRLDDTQDRLVLKSVKERLGTLGLPATLLRTKTRLLIHRNQPNPNPQPSVLTITASSFYNSFDGLS